VSSIFRSFRLLRILKLAKSVQSLRVLLATVGESVSNVSYLTLLLFLFIFIFAVFGMQGRGALCSDNTRRVVGRDCSVHAPRSWMGSLCLPLTLHSAVFAGTFTKGRGLTIADMSYHFGAYCAQPA
jgi:hypothetical protein